MKFIMALLVGASTLVSFAGTVRFSATAQNSDLATPANWEGSALPGADDVAVVPVAAGVTLRLNGNLNVKGIDFENAGLFVISGAGELSIGSEGLSCSASAPAGTLVGFNAPMRTVCDQTWDFKGRHQPLFQKSIAASGTETLTITGVASIQHMEVADYGGTIRYSGTGELLYLGDATKRWAQKVYSSGLYIKIRNKTDYAFSDLVPEGLVQDSFVQQILVNDEQDYKGKTMTFGPLAIYTNTCNYTYFGQNTIDQTGGSFCMNGLLCVWGGTYLLEGGKMSFAGYGPLVGISSGRSVFRQTGGAFVGSAYVAIGAGADDSTAYSEARVEGGTMTFANPGAKILVSPNFYAGGLVNPNPGIFSQTGGEVTVPTIQFGHDNWVWGGSDVLYQTNGHALVDLAGGLLKLGANPFAVGRNWNRSAQHRTEPAPEANGTYDIRLHGVTVQGTAGVDWSNSYQLAFPPSLGATTLDWGAKDIVFQAPVWGEGGLRKVGSGTWKMTDAVRFTGTLNVSEGSVVFSGEPQDAYTDDCVILTGDTAAGDKADAADVTRWTDESGTLTATLLSEQIAEAATACLYPRVVRNAFNGHAGVRFRRETDTSKVTALAIPSAVNPLACGTNCTVAIVFKTTAANLGGNSDDYQWAYQTGVLGFSMGINTMGISIANNGQMSGARNYYNKGDVRVSTDAAVNKDGGQTHVFVYATDGNTLTATCDGQVTRRTTSFDLDKFCQFACWSGVDSSRYPVDMPFCIGLHSPMAWKESPYYAFDGDIAEIRIYKDRILSEREINGLTAALRAKYVSATDRTVFAKTIEVEAAMPAVGAAPDLPSDAVTFSAGTLTVADGAPVESWASEDGSKVATTAVVGGFAAPVLAKSVISGKPAVRFDGASALGLSATDSPIAGSTDFALAVVFRTTVDGPAATGDRGGAGLVSASAGDAAGQNDVCLSYRADGALAATYGGSASVTIHNLKPCRLGDGAVHLAVVSFDSASRTLTRCVDGRRESRLVESASARDAVPLLFGARAPGLDGFVGYIAAVSLWTRALSRSEQEAVVEHYAQTYSFRPLATEPFAAGAELDNGLGAKSIRVASGATFRMPYSHKSPFTLSAGQSLSGDGEFKGTYRFADGARVDPADFPSGVEEVQLASDVVLVVSDLPVTPRSIPGLVSVSGDVLVDVAALSSLPPFGWTPVLSLDPSVIAAGTTFAPVGSDGKFRIKVANGQLMIRKNGGMTVTIR